MDYWKTQFKNVLKHIENSCIAYLHAVRHKIPHKNKKYGLSEKLIDYYTYEEGLYRLPDYLYAWETMRGYYKRGFIKKYGDRFDVDIHTLRRGCYSQNIYDFYLTNHSPYWTM